jgi:cytoskeletal protein CcmA (bactofilin family)
MKAGEQGGTNIGKDVRIRGELSGTEDIFIDGDVEGTISFPDAKFTVGPGGRVHANVTARDVIVHGRVDGHLKAAARVELKQGAQVIGDITAARLSIEDTAILKGKVELVQKSATSATAAQSTPAIAPEAKPQQATLPSVEPRISTGVPTTK